MYLTKFLLVLTLLSCTTFANEEHEKAEGAAPVNEAYSGKQDQSWEAVQAEVGALKAKLDAQAIVVQNLIAEKENLKGEALSEKIDQIKKEHLKYEKLVFDYNVKNEEFLTRYPERGLKEKRIYKRVKTKSLSSFEDDVTLRGRMNKLHNKVLRQYPQAFKGEKNKNESTGADKSKSKSGDVTEAIKFDK